jgi:hypothetical protein
VRVRACVCMPTADHLRGHTGSCSSMCGLTAAPCCACTTHNRARRQQRLRAFGSACSAACVVVQRECEQARPFRLCVHRHAARALQWWGWARSFWLAGSWVRVAVLPATQCAWWRSVRVLPAGLFGLAWHSFCIDSWHAWGHGTLCLACMPKPRWLVDVPWASPAVRSCLCV